MKEEDVKLFLFANDMMLYLEGAKDSTKNLLDLTSKFSKITVFLKSAYKTH